MVSVLHFGRINLTKKSISRIYELITLLLQLLLTFLEDLCTTVNFYYKSIRCAIASMRAMPPLYLNWHVIYGSSSSSIN